MCFKMSKEEFVALLNRLSIAHTVEKVNEDIVHIKMWHNGKMFRARFVYNNYCYMFTNFLEG